MEESSVFTNKMGYGHITGSPKLKANIAACYDSASGITQDNVLITQGAIGANFLAILGLVQSGDHVVVVSPSYQQLQELPKSFGASVSLWSLQERHGWEHRVEDLKPLLRPNTRLVIVNNPNNPTGGIITTNTLQQIHAAVKEKAAPDAMILCDEVYSPMWHSLKDAHQGRPASLLEIGVDNVIVTGSMSKAFALAGLRVGWIVTPRKDLLARLLTIRDYNVISVSAVDDELAARALNPKAKQHLLERNIRLAQNNRAILHDWVRDTSKELGTRWSEPQAGNTALIYLGNGVDDAELCASLCEQKGVVSVLCLTHITTLNVIGLEYCTSRTVLWPSRLGQGGLCRGYAPAERGPSHAHGHSALMATQGRKSIMTCRRILCGVPQQQTCNV